MRFASISLGTNKSYGKIENWMDSKGEEISMWQAMIDRPDTWIDGTLLLRPHMSPRGLLSGNPQRPPSSIPTAGGRGTPASGRATPVSKRLAGSGRNTPNL